MIVTKENEKYIRQANDVDFLTEKWEIEWYAKVLIDAVAWGEKVDKENVDYRKKHRLTDKYNV